MNELKDRLQLLRGEASREDFAIIVGVKPTTWRNYELGSTLPNSDVLLTICKKLNITPSWLLAGEGSMHPRDTQTEEESHGRPPTVTFTPIPLCPNCSKMEAELEQERTERRVLSAENRKLWKENGDLREHCARLEERQNWLNESKTSNIL